MNKGKETHIKIDVQLDENKVPEKIVWSAPDGGVNDEEAQALLMSCGTVKIRKHFAWISG